MARLRSLLDRALERFEPQSESTARATVRNRRLHTIIAQCDVAGEKHESVARSLGLSLRQFYRERSAAFARLADALHEELSVSDAAGRRQGAAGDAGHNLPWQPTSFIGRRREVEEIGSLIARRRVVTITGSGGTGKTRIALEVASRIEYPPRDGIWFVDLAPINDGDLVFSKFASVLDMRLPEQGDVLGALVAAIERRDLMFIADNCEHVIGHVRRVAEAMLNSCPHVAVLATSRERLGISGELTYQLSTLPVPSKAVATAAEARSYAALELFAERAATAQHGVAIADEQVEAASDICRRLDGIALAIELAAARLPVLGLSELRAQIAEHFQVICSGRQDGPARQQTLYATISWSYDLLAEPERVLFRRLAIFASGWTIEGATAVCEGGALGKAAVLDALFSLVEKSLVVVDLDAEIPRYSFFESTRAYASEQLDASGERRHISHSHARWMATFADRAYDAFLVTTRSRWGMLVAPELDNALTALEWALGPEDEAVLGGRIASGLTGLWLIAGLAAYGQRYVSATLERIDAGEHPLLVARLLMARSQFLHGTPNADALERAIALLESSGDRRMLARCNVYLSYTLASMGRYSEAEIVGDKALELLTGESLLRSPLYARLLSDRSTIQRAQGRLDDAKASLAKALSLAVGLDDDWSIALCQSLLAEIEFTTGDPRRAVVLGEEALASARRVRQEDFSLCNLACYQLAVGGIDLAEKYARQALDLARSNPNIVLSAVQHLAAVAAMRGDARCGARVLGYTNAWYDRVGRLRDATDQKGYDLAMESLRRQLGEDEISTLAAQGARLTESAAVDEASNLAALSV
jgi:predicted ATPase